jgi:hypothetical protein
MCSAVAELERCNCRSADPRELLEFLLGQCSPLPMLPKSCQFSIAQPRTVPNSDTRELRALELYRGRGDEIRKASPDQDLYLVPSCTGNRGFYSVDYREETCDCPDFEHRGENCSQLVVDPETGEETEEYAVYLCRRCADSR